MKRETSRRQRPLFHEGPVWQQLDESLQRQLIGRLADLCHLLVAPPVPLARLGWWWSPHVRRSILASDLGAEFVYAVSDAGIRSADVARLPEWLATIQFPPYPMP